MSALMLCPGRECNASFMNTADLYAHLSFLHCQYCPLECAVCGERLPSDQRLSEHWALTHSDKAPRPQSFNHYDAAKDNQLIKLIMRTNTQDSSPKLEPLRGYSMAHPLPAQQNNLRPNNIAFDKPTSSALNEINELCGRELGENDGILKHSNEPEVLQEKPYRQTFGSQMSAASSHPSISDRIEPARETRSTRQSSEQAAFTEMDQGQDDSPVSVLIDDEPFDVIDAEQRVFTVQMPYRIDPEAEWLDITGELKLNYFYRHLEGKEVPKAYVEVATMDLNELMAPEYTVAMATPNQQQRMNMFLNMEAFNNPGMKRQADFQFRVHRRLSISALVHHVTIRTGEKSIFDICKPVLLTPAQQQKLIMRWFIDYPFAFDEAFRKSDFVIEQFYDAKSPSRAFVYNRGRRIKLDPMRWEMCLRDWQLQQGSAQQEKDRFHQLLYSMNERAHNCYDSDKAMESLSLCEEPCDKNERAPNRNHIPEQFLHPCSVRHSEEELRFVKSCTSQQRKQFYTGATQFSDEFEAQVQSAKSKCKNRVSTHRDRELIAMNDFVKMGTKADSSQLGQVINLGRRCYPLILNWFRKLNRANNTDMQFFLGKWPTFASFPALLVDFGLEYVADRKPRTFDMFATSFINIGQQLIITCLQAASTTRAHQLAVSMVTDVNDEQSAFARCTDEAHFVATAIRLMSFVMAYPGVAQATEDLNTATNRNAVDCGHDYVLHKDSTTNSIAAVTEHARRTKNITQPMVLMLARDGNFQNEVELIAVSIQKQDLIIKCESALYAIYTLIILHRLFHIQYNQHSRTLMNALEQILFEKPDEESTISEETQRVIDEVVVAMDKEDISGSKLNADMSIGSNASCASASKPKRKRMS